VVMLHASLSSKSQWKGLADRLAPHFRTIAIDLRGYGDNALPAKASFTLDDELRLVTSHLERLVPARARMHLVGHSYGGLVALRLAQSLGNRVASLSLYEPVVFRLLAEDDACLSEVRRLATGVRQLCVAERRDRATELFVDFWSGAGSYASLSATVRASMARRVEKVALDFQAALDWPSRPTDLRALTAPTLLLAGRRSPPVAQRIRALLASTIPNCQVRQFDAGHMAPIADASRVNPWIEAFVHLCSTRGPAFAAASSMTPALASNSVHC